MWDCFLVGKDRRHHWYVCNCLSVITKANKSNADLTGDPTADCDDHECHIKSALHTVKLLVLGSNGSC